MLRKKRQAAMKCEEKLHVGLKTSKKIKKMPKSQSNEETNKTRACSVLLTKSENIPQTLFNERNIKPCSIKLTKADEIPISEIMKYSRNCVYEPSTNGQLLNREFTTAVETSRPEDKIYDFLPSSHSSRSGGSDDESMKNILQKLQSKGNVRVVKGRKKGKAPRKCLNKSWTEKNIRKAKKLIKPPKMNKIDKVQIIEVVKNNMVIPLKKHQNNINKSILPSIDNNVSKDKPPEISKLDKLQNIENRNNVAIPVKKHQNNINKSILASIDHNMSKDKPSEMSKLDKVQSVELKNNVVIPTKQQNNINESILPLIDNISEDNDHFGNDDFDHFGNDDTDYSNENQMNNSNIENINPNLSTPKTNIVNFKPIVRSPLKPLNTQIINRPKPPSSKKDTPTLRNNLLRRLSLCNASMRSSRTKIPNRISTDEESQSKIEDANVTNYFGFTSDLVSEPSMKNASSNTSTPVRPMTKDTLISKLLKLRSTVLESKKKCPPRAATRSKRKAIKKKQPIEVSENSTVNFENALTSTLLEPTLTRNKNVRRTYARHQNKNQKSNEKTAIEIDLFDNPVEVFSSSSDDTILRSPVKKGHAKVYEKKKVHVAKKVEEDPQLQSFYESFNNECQEVDKFKLIIQ